MQFDRTKGQDRLERPTRELVADRHSQSREQPRAYAAAVTQAAATPAHGCWEQESAEEYERWDGMS